MNFLEGMSRSNQRHSQVYTNQELGRVPSNELLFVHGVKWSHVACLDGSKKHGLTGYFTLNFLSENLRVCS